MTITHHQGVNAGPRCDSCGRRETECAYRQGCCNRCQHFQDLDTDGNSKTARPPDPP